MYVVTVSHKNSLWTQCYGPFDTYLEAQEYWKENYGEHYYRTLVLQVVSPVE